MKTSLNTLKFKSIFNAGILSFLLILISTSTINAQEKKNDFKVKNTTIEYQITKETKDNELEQIKKEVNDEKIAALNFSNIKRNDKGEIIAINTMFKDERGSSQQKSEYNSMGINSFSIIIHEKENGYKYLEIGNSGNNLFSNKSNFSMQSSMWGDDAEGDDFFATDFMDLMKSMQEDMKMQQEAFMKMMLQNQEPTKDKNTSTQTNEKSKK
ncbi:hypothetical protein [Myroides injenensis]|uniref:hypothetical protein n=1 Tax=Myroides injenensis TaxID=1183151 RepID=UPI000288F058|nr:hypothetical protein [Myroides injenensis]